LIDYLYTKLQRKGYLYRDCARLIKTNRHIFAGALVATGYADGMVTGLSNNYNYCLDEILKTLPQKNNQEIFSYSIFVAKNHHLLIADTNINENPTAQQLVAMCMHLANVAKDMGYKPRVALITASNFCEDNNISKAMQILSDLNVDFEYDGALSPEVALNAELLKLYPFCKLSGPANILIMPNLLSAAISTQLLSQVAEGSLIGPILSGLAAPAQIVHLDASSQDIVTGAAFAANDAIKNKKNNK
jgi:malate dehydrogenase (oxaloacetate-decarboxylating)(NADP+)